MVVSQTAWKLPRWPPNNGGTIAQSYDYAQRWNAWVQNSILYAVPMWGYCIRFCISTGFFYSDESNARMVNWRRSCLEFCQKQLANYQSQHAVCNFIQSLPGKRIPAAKERWGYVVSELSIAISPVPKKILWCSNMADANASDDLKLFNLTVVLNYCCN